ncbi:hypothetical protein [Clostridium thermarum]|uniref:hypothetical protein n=1 Tax=Clostridium thermarum TaxID=1716543 RepID=UPI001122AC9A|nr:hypothetical protein [Clostridium thermarum]
MNQYKFFWVFFITISIVVISMNIYKKYFKKLESYKDYLYRAVKYEMLFQGEKAISILKKALFELKDISNYERYAILIELGNLYYKRKFYSEANIYYKEALKIILDEEFYYDKSLINILNSFIFADEKQNAMSLYENLIKRQSYDIKFSKIKKFSKLIYR